MDQLFLPCAILVRIICALVTQCAGHCFGSIRSRMMYDVCISSYFESSISKILMYAFGRVMIGYPGNQWSFPYQHLWQNSPSMLTFQVQLQYHNQWALLSYVWSILKHAAFLLSAANSLFLHGVPWTTWILDALCAPGVTSWSRVYKYTYWSSDQPAGRADPRTLTCSSSTYRGFILHTEAAGRRP